MGCKCSAKQHRINENIISTSKKKKDQNSYPNNRSIIHTKATDYKSTISHEEEPSLNEIHGKNQIEIGKLNKITKE